MKAKNIKYYLTPLLLALKISLVGCGKGVEVEKKVVENDATNLFDGKEIELPNLGEIAKNARFEEKNVDKDEELEVVRELTIIGNEKDDGYEIQYMLDDNSLNYLVREGIDETREYLDTLIFADGSVNFMNCGDLEILEAISHPEIIKNLSIRWASITDLSVLEEYENLENLRIHNCSNLENIDALQHLTKLKEFSMLDTNVSDIHSLSNLKNVTLLDLRCNQIEDVSALQELPKLQRIYLEYNQIMDTKSLKFLEEKGLISEYGRYLIPATVWNGDISISYQEYCSQTHFYQLRIQKMESKEKLFGNEYFVETYDEEGNLCRYTLMNKNDDVYYFKDSYDTIVLSGVEDLSMLEKLENKDTVTGIDILSCALSSLKGIEDFQNVTNLSISNCNQLSEIPELSKMENLSCVTIKNVPITEIYPLCNLKNLENLWVSYTYADDLDSILELPKLEEVYFIWNREIDIDDVRALKEKGVFVEFNMEKRSIYKEKVKEYTE